MVATLYPWQAPLADELHKKFVGSTVVLNAMPTGTGKTYITAHVMQKVGKEFLVICPKSIIGAWKSVLEDFEIPKEQCLGVLNPEKLRAENTPWFAANKWKLPSGASVVWDEPHKGASGFNSKLTEIMALTKAWKIPMILQSATIADSPLKLRAAGFLLGLHGYRTAEYFKWCTDHGCWFDTDYKYWRFPTGRKGMEIMAGIRKQIENACVYYPLSDVPGFPESQIEAKLFDLEARYTKEYNEIAAELELRLQDQNANKFTETLRARQKAEILKVPLLNDLVQERLDEGLSVVVFFNFLDAMHGLKAALAMNKIDKVSLIHGGQTAEQRSEEIRKFQNNENIVCLCMIQAGGVGISLHDTLQQRMRFAYICPSYSASDVKQSLGRIHRAGGSKTVQVFPLAAGTIEEKIYRSIKNKLNNIDALNDANFAW